MEDRRGRECFEALVRGEPNWSERAVADPDRPRYHFLPAPGWMNDPIPFFARGAYHVFFQYNPSRPFWGDMHWGHAVSRDLVHWRELPVALAPSPGGPDAEGCWTGCVVEDGDRYVALYTGVDPQVQCLAESRDLVTWEKRAEPVIPAMDKPSGGGDTFRDPCVWREGGDWRMVLGGDLPGGAGGRPLLYRSADLERWTYDGVLCGGEGVLDECPDLFPLGDGAVLLSSRGHVAWAAGPFDGRRLHVERHGVLEQGAGYAAKTLADASGRRVAFSWLREARPVEEQVRAGWSGVLSLPRVVGALPDGSLGVAPAPELEALRVGEAPLEDIRSDGCYEVEAELLPSGGQPCGLVLQGDVRVQCSPAHGSVRLRVFVDRSVIEVFENGRGCQTLRRYGPAEDRVEVFGAPVVRRLTVWRLQTG